MPCRFLIVEDEPLIQMLWVEIIEDLGHSAACAVSVETAISVIANESIDAAILDFDLRGTSSGPVATILRQHFIPFAVATGHTLDLLGAEFAETVVLAKPFKEDDAKSLILQLSAYK